MANHEIASVVWDERDHQIYVTYVDDEPDHMLATQLIAAELARDAGLNVVVAPNGICQWVRNPATLCVATDRGSTGNAPSPDHHGVVSARKSLSAVARDALWVRDPHF